MNKQPEIPNPNSETIRVLLIEDNPGDVHLIKDALDNVNAVTFNLECFNRLSTGLERLAGGGIDVVLLDLLLPDSQGLDSFTKIYAQAPKVPIIVLTGNKDETLAINAMREGAQDYLVKGQMDDNLLGRTIRYAIERKKAEEMLRESEEKYRALVENSPNLIGIIQEGVIKYVNMAACERLGWTFKEMTSPSFNPVEKLVAPIFQDLGKEKLTKRLRGEHIPPYEFNFKARDGSEIPVIVYAQRILYDGKPADMVNLVDITERKRVEEVLRESQETACALLNASTSAAFLIDTTGTILAVNEIGAQDFDKSIDKIIGSRITDLLSTEVAENRKRRAIEAIQSGKPIRFEDESEGRCFDINIYPVFNGEKNVNRLAIYARDITEHKRAEEALRESEERYRAIFEQAADSIVLVDAENGALVEFNDRAYKNLGYTRKEFKKLKIPDVEVIESPDEVANHSEKILKEGADTFETKQRTKRGEIRDIQVSGRAICIRGRNFVQGIWHDITERKRAEEALQREKHAVQRLAEEREAVAKIGRIIGSTLEIEKVYELFAEEVRKIIPFDRIGINIIYPERDIFTIAYIAGRDVEGHRPGDVSTMAGSLTEEVVRTHSSLLIQIGDRDEVEGRFPGLLPNFQAGFRSFMAVPLISKDQVMGVLHLQSVKPNAYMTADANLTESIGSQIAGTIANAQLYQELKRQWAFSATLIDNMSEGMGVLDEKGRLEFGNRRLFQMLGYSLEESVGMHWTSLVHPDDHEVMRAQGASGKNPRSSSYECRMLCKGGTSVPVLISWAPRFDDQGQQRGSVGIVTDLTERKRTERRLREYEARYSHLLDHMPDGVALSRRGRIIRVNPPMARMFGYPSPEKVEGLYTWDLAAPVSKEIMRQRSTLRALGQQGKNRFEFQALRRDGLSFPAEVTLTVDRSELQPFVLIIIRDVTERKKHENQRKLLSDRIITAQEKERTLIARELHDELGQALTGIKMDMAWIKGHMKGQDDAVSQRFMALGELIDSSIESVRKMATSLRPSILDRLGLAAAIEWHANEFERRTGIECIIESLASDFNITSKTAINAYRIFQEALTNVARHAGASRVDVRMIEDRENLTICISDDGRGISSRKFSGPTSLGIAGMRERAELVNGRLDIKSQKGKGTRVTAYLPLSPKGSKP